jgi:hypothetical protein
LAFAFLLRRRSQTAARPNPQTSARHPATPPMMAPILLAGLELLDSAGPNVGPAAGGSVVFGTLD